jgi:transposase
VRVLEVNQPHAHTRRRRGKTDAIDAEMAARHALSLASAVVPKHTTGIVEAIRQLRVARDSAVKSRSVAMLQLGDLILTAPSELREKVAARTTLKARAALCRKLRPDSTRLNDPVNAAKLALRSLARRIALLDDEIAELDTQLTPLVAAAAPRTTALLGISTGHAGQLLVTAGQNIDRLRGEGAFAALCGASPIPVASGKHGRYRLNPGGDRQANRALHMIAVCRLRYCPDTRAYAERRTTEGKTKKEIMRCLKRYIARQVYATLRDDLRSLSLS